MKLLAVIAAALLAVASAEIVATDQPCGHDYQCADAVPFPFTEKYCIDLTCHYKLPTPCDSTPCLNNGNCVNLNDEEFDCSCVTGFDGELCEVNVDDCVSAACVHGSCVDGVNSYTCECDDGWSGDFCSVNIDECASSPCLHDGTCQDGINAFSCSCVSGFLGFDCGFPAIFQTATECGHDYQCTDNIGFAFVQKYCINNFCAYERTLPSDYNGGGSDPTEAPTSPPAEGDWESDGVECGHDYQCADKAGFEKACLSFTCNYRATSDETPTTPPQNEDGWVVTATECGHDYQCPDDVANNIVNEKRCNNNFCEYKLTPIYQTTDEVCGHDYQCADEVGFTYLTKACLNNVCSYQVLPQPEEEETTSSPAPSSPGDGWTISPSGDACGHDYQCVDIAGSDKVCFQFVCWYHATAPTR